MFFKNLFARLNEPSSWAGFSVLAAIIGLNPAYITSLHGLATAGAAALAVFIPEKVAGQ